MVGEVGPKTYAGFLVGGQEHTFWWVELHLVPLSGRPMSRGVFGGVCEISITWGSLSADGWGYVPVLLVIWSETFQQWSLQAVEWGQILMPKWEPPGELTPNNIPWGLHYQCPYLHSELQASPSSPGEPQRPIGRSTPSSFVGTALWDLVHVRPCVYFPKVMSLFPPNCGSPALKLLWLSKLSPLGVLPLNARLSVLEGYFYVWTSLSNLHGSMGLIYIYKHTYLC